MVDCLLLSNIQSNHQQQIYLAQGSGPPEPGWRLPPASGGDYDRPSVANSPARAVSLGAGGEGWPLIGVLRPSGERHGGISVECHHLMPSAASRPASSMATV